MTAASKAKPPADLVAELTRLKRRQAVTEAVVRQGMSLVPGGGHRVMDFDAALARADQPPPFAAGARVQQVESLEVGEVLRMNAVTDVCYVRWENGKESPVPAVLLTAYQPDGDRN
jgi:hypothetical protein